MGAVTVTLILSTADTPSCCVWILIPNATRSGAGARLWLPEDPYPDPASVPTEMGLWGLVIPPQAECPECAWVSLSTQRDRCPLLRLGVFFPPSSQHRDRALADVEESPGHGALEHHPSPGRGLRHGQRL